jgi:hypothetical protein
MTMRRHPDGAGGSINPGLGLGPSQQATASPSGISSKIQAFENKLGAKRHEDSWSRTPNATGHGAIHCRTFHCKLSDDAIGYLDQQVNEWLDAHPQYEVKFVTSNIGEWSGKLGKEPHLVICVWV